MSTKEKKVERYFIGESLKGLVFGLLLMVIVFLICHFVLGIKAFS